MSALPEYTKIPRHLMHRSGLKREGLAPTAAPVALYVYRTPAGGWQRCELFDRQHTRPLAEAHAARKRRLAAIHGQSPLF